MMKRALKVAVGSILACDVFWRVLPMVVRSYPHALARRQAASRRQSETFLFPVSRKNVLDFGATSRSLKVVR
jgi:hypothetical protein